MQRLHLDPQHDRHVLNCCFHHDGETPSLSVDLSKGVYFCHGACDDPKGGDAIAFLVKWARVKEHKTITRDDARRQLSAGFTTLTAQQAVVEALRDEIRVFVRAMLASPASFASQSRMLSNQIDDVTVFCQGVPPPGDSPVWDELAALYRAQQEVDQHDATLRASLRRLRPDTVALFELAKTRGWWSPLTYRQRIARDETLRQIEARALRYFTTHPTPTTKEPIACPSSRLKSPMPCPPTTRPTPSMS